MWLAVERAKNQGCWLSACRLNEGLTTVGRSDKCDLVINDGSVSRLHAEIEYIDGAVTVHNKSKKKGVIIDGKRQEVGRLQVGQGMDLGDIRFVLIGELPALPTAEAGLVTTSSDGKAVPLDLKALGGFLESMGNAAEPKVLVNNLLTAAVRLLGADRGFVMLRPRRGSRLEPVVAHSLDEKSDLIEISRSVCEESLSKNDLVIVEDSAKDNRFNTAASLVHFEIPRRIYCAPLAKGGDSFGAIYVDCAINTQKENEAHQRVFLAMARMASSLLAGASLRRELLATRKSIGVFRQLTKEKDTHFIGEGPASQELKKMLVAVADQDVSVLITGETGTGKEVMARAIHQRSQRATGPFVPVNCAALPRDLIEAELFGALKGAFSGAGEDRIGRFEMAEGGTLFLDEVGELPEDFQVKLLRVLQERTITPLGSNEQRRIDFRLVCATNSELEDAISEGTFRQDLYYRINVFRLELPPLRQRREDIVHLARHFLDDIKSRTHKPIKDIAPEAVKVLEDHVWPGNIRELRNAIERAVVIEQGPMLTVSSLPIVKKAPGATSSNFLDDMPGTIDAAVDEFQRMFILRAIERHEKNAAAAARALGISRSTLYRRMTKLGMQVDR